MKTLHFENQGCRTGLLVLLALWATSVRADQEGDFTFSRNGTRAELTGYTGPGGVVVIPDRLGNLPVARIGFRAFAEHTDLTSITIPNSVTAIEHSAFSGCTGLRALEVDPLNVTYSSASGVLLNQAQSRLIAYPPGRVGPYTIPNSVTAIGWSAFSGCTGLTSVYFEGNPPGVGEYLGSGVSVFEGSAFVTVFHRPGAAGWTATFEEWPTAVWVPRPAFGAWAVATGLMTLHPNASAEGDDPDGDGFANGAEWFTGTDPTQRASRLELELAPRAAELSAADQTPIEPGQHAVYFRSVPDHYYGVQHSTGLGGAWELQATKVATSPQTRFVLPQPTDHGFYRVLALP